MPIRRRTLLIVAALACATWAYFTLIARAAGLILPEYLYGAWQSEATYVCISRGPGYTYFPLSGSGFQYRGSVVSASGTSLRVLAVVMPLRITLESLPPTASGALRAALDGIPYTKQADSCDYGQFPRAATPR